MVYVQEIIHASVSLLERALLHLFSATRNVDRENCADGVGNYSGSNLIRQKMMRVPLIGSSLFI